MPFVLRHHFIKHTLGYYTHAVTWIGLIAVWSVEAVLGVGSCECQINREKTTDHTLCGIVLLRGGELKVMHCVE